MAVDRYVATSPAVTLVAGANATEVAYLRQASRIVIAVDLRRRPDTLTADLCLLPFAEGSIDLIVAWHVLEHIPKDRAAISEMERSLRPGGCALISVPVTPPESAFTWEDPLTPVAEREAVYGHPDHVRRCGLDYGDRLTDAGLHTELLAVDQLTPSQVERLGLSLRDVVWVGTKPQ